MLGLAYMVDHPKLEPSSHVQWKIARANNGYAIVKGINPKAAGNIGDILALAREYPDSHEIVQIACAQVDGKKILPNTWYNINLEKSGENL